ncbi:MAG TPA: carbohydrate ABC transporter permease [Thermoanaerobaculia bacterium]|nr:carbohydrate ABC transporter permease [Thermoanaerobaculia bacterium]
MRPPHKSISAWLTIALAVSAVAPVVALLSMSLRRGASVLAVRSFLPPSDPSLANFAEVLREPGFAIALANSVLVSAVTVCSNLLLGVLTAWGIVRVSGGVRRDVLATLIFAIAVPPQAVVIPIFLIFEQWALLDTYAALLLPGLLIPLNVLLYVHAIRAIPPSLLEAAALDGASPAYVLRRVVLPLVTPTSAVVAINTFLASWSAFVYPFLLTNSSNRRTLAVALALLKTQDQVRWPLVMAGAVITIIPVILVFLIARRRLVDGVTAAAVKS